MKKLFVVVCSLIGLATLFPPVMIHHKWSFLFSLPLVKIHDSGLLYGGRIDWSKLLAEYVLIISFSFAGYYGRKWITGKKGMAGEKEPPQADKPGFDPMAFIEELITKNPRKDDIPVPEDMLQASLKRIEAWGNQNKKKSLEN